ncbi:hypothetical protein I4F81_006977 [Pyropia yezoensis]|uniref:Uncharacterized protein n=1 Tax=Pyropia yezoensis TaxID=2788 RepID=A0ACC3C2T2_PYRYE|nr:hypothetical protein I4F81_006977 [Neopyropia yezoensis]
MCSYCTDVLSGPVPRSPYPCRSSAGQGVLAPTAKVLRWSTLKISLSRRVAVRVANVARGCRRCVPLHIRADGDRCAARLQRGHPRSSSCHCRHHRRTFTAVATATAAAAAAAAAATAVQ